MVDKRFVGHRDFAQLTEWSSKSGPGICKPCMCPDPHFEPNEAGCAILLSHAGHRANESVLFQAKEQVTPYLQTLNATEPTRTQLPGEYTCVTHAWIDDTSSPTPALGREA